MDITRDCPVRRGIGGSATLLPDAYIQEPVWHDLIVLRDDGGTGRNSFLVCRFCAQFGFLGVWQDMLAAPEPRADVPWDSRRFMLRQENGEPTHADPTSA